MFMPCSMSETPSTLFPGVPERIVEIIFALCQTLTMRLRAQTVTQARLTYIVGRLLGIRMRFQRLVARIRAGNPPRERARSVRAPSPAPEFPSEFPLGFRSPPPGWRRWAMPADTFLEKPGPLWRSPRQDFAWLLPLAPSAPQFRDSAAAHRALLLGVLAEPRMRALLMASRRVGDSPPPLRWMLGIDVSVLYPAAAARASVGSGVDVVASAPAATADHGVPDPVTDNTASSAVAARVVATAGPIVTGVIEPLTARARQGGDFFATA
jgi:hypothetical protein